MKTISTKNFVNNFEITLTKNVTKRRIRGTKNFREVTFTKTEVKGLKNVSFFMYNDFGNRSVCFSLDFLTEDELNFLKSKTSDPSKYDDMEYGEKENALFIDSGLMEELSKAYTEWYGVEVA